MSGTNGYGRSVVAMLGSLAAGLVVSIGTGIYGYGQLTQRVNHVESEAQNNRSSIAAESAARRSDSKEILQEISQLRTSVAVMENKLDRVLTEREAFGGAFFADEYSNRDARETETGTDG